MAAYIAAEIKTAKDKATDVVGTAKADAATSL